MGQPPGSLQQHCKRDSPHQTKAEREGREHQSDGGPLQQIQRQHMKVKTHKWR